MGFMCHVCAGRIKITMTHGTEKMRETEVSFKKINCIYRNQAVRLQQWKTSLQSEMSHGWVTLIFGQWHNTFASASKPLHESNCCRNRI